MHVHRAAYVANTMSLSLHSYLFWGCWLTTSVSWRICDFTVIKKHVYSAPTHSFVLVLFMHHESYFTFYSSFVTLSIVHLMHLSFFSFFVSWNQKGLLCVCGDSENMQMVQNHFKRCTWRHAEKRGSCAWRYISLLNKTHLPIMQGKKMLIWQKKKKKKNLEEGLYKLSSSVKVQLLERSGRCLEG